jgi:hypothetical protein
MESLANPTPTAFEIALLDALLAGDHPYLSALRLQRRTAMPVKREWSTAGEFLTFQVQPDVSRVSPPSFEIHDVHFHMQGIDHPFGGAVLFIRNGVVDFLETYSYVDDFPTPGLERDFSLSYYMDPEGRTERIAAELEWRARGSPLDGVPDHIHMTQVTAEELKQLTEAVKRVTTEFESRRPTPRPS